MALLGHFEGVGRECDDVVAAVDSKRAFESLFEGRHDDRSAYVSCQSRRPELWAAQYTLRVPVNQPLEEATTAFAGTVTLRVIDGAVRLLSALALVSPAAHGAPPVVPGAGTILQEIQPVTPPAPASNGTGLRIEPEHGAPPPASSPFAVKAVRITGNTAFEAGSLHALIGDAEGQELTLPQLNALAARLSNYYHAHGYPLARAIIPAQTIRDGVVTIAIIEAQYGSISLENRSRVRDALLHSTLSALRTGQLIAQAPLDHALLLFSDIPGVLTSATLKPGEAVGTSDLVVQSASGPAVTGNVDLDNYGNRYTGNARLGGTVNLIDPLQCGDVLSVNGLSSGSGLNYGRIGYETLLDGEGTRAGAAYSTLHYILGNSLTALDGHGTAQVASLWSKRPFVRTPTLNIYAQLQFDHKRLDDELGAGDIHTDRHLNDWTASLAGDWRDAILAGAVSSWTVATTVGRLGFDNADAQFSDAATAHKRGRFSRWSASLSRLQSVGPQNALYVALSGQATNGNIDASEKLIAGGPYSVRAYDTGALSGDTGYLGSLEYRHELGPVDAGRWQVIGFLDSEHLSVNRSPWTASTNSATLSGAGFGLNFAARFQWYAKAYLAAPFGPTPVLVGSEKSVRVWVETGWNF
jgi:hemolysin activation/secretion protein